MRLKVLAAFLGLAVTAGCATLPDNASPEKIVQQRAQTRWDAMIAGDYEKAYQYMLPSYRALHDYESFRSQINPGAARWKGAEIVGVECEKEACTAKVRIDFEIALGRDLHHTLNTHFDEKWISENGSWWFYQKP